MAATDCSLVHNIETTVDLPHPQSYQAFNTRKDPQEWVRAVKIYEYFDNLEGQFRAQRLSDCRKIAWFVRDKETDQVKVAANSCRLRWCPLCSSARKAYVTGQVRAWLPKADHPKMLTLTLKHSDAPLGHQVKHLYLSFRKLRLTKPFRDSVSGGIWFFQIKRSNNSGQWHPHLHCLVTGKYISRRVISQLWLKVTLTSDVIDIRSVKDPDHVADEVARYCSRPARLVDNTLSDGIELFSAMFGRRLCGAWGTAKQINLRTPKLEDGSRFVRLARWSTLSRLIDKDTRANEIYKAWLTGTPLEINTSLMEYENFLDGVPDMKPIPPPENYLWSQL